MKVNGLGIDVISIKRFQEILSSRAGKDFLKNNFTERERPYAKNTMALAAIFAAKEAVFKAFGTGWTEGKSVEILRDKKGAPKVKLHGKMNQLIKKRKIKNVSLSLSYTDCCAVAVAVICS